MSIRKTITMILVAGSLAACVSNPNGGAPFGPGQPNVGFQPQPQQPHVPLQPVGPIGPPNQNNVQVFQPPPEVTGNPQLPPGVGQQQLGPVGGQPIQPVGGLTPQTVCRTPANAGGNRVVSQECTIIRP